MTHPSRPHKTHRAGFTLVELLVVILILAILIALLVPAISAAVRSANDARVSGEINTLVTALADFKNTYNEYPPSRILLPVGNNSYSNILSQAGASAQVYNAGGLADISVRDLAARSQRTLLKFFPRATGLNSFSVPGTGSYVILQGHECLVFFLGGMPSYDLSTRTFSMKGFSKDPTAPFSTAGNNRTKPFYDFPSGRLADIYSTQIAAGGATENGFPSYLDPLGSGVADSRPYSYFCAYGNNGYDPNDDNMMGIGMYEVGASTPTVDTVELNEDQTGKISRSFNVSFPPREVASYGPNPYTSTLPYYPPNPPPPPVTYINPQSFQIISAGRDRQFGLGGAFTPNATGNKLPVSAAESALQELRNRERDNITNFATGKLD